ncbi:hypothetical protein B0H16DRAFT_1468355 [Mycena metata]|uniref:Uncharacterized protein n=1 Tax=Mycena metata TaxID=1033252 RepID=A0AAD7I264_9AGAR|nr:hypothetical protein B0H16DRAFT_1468355 [Mycena metata]
MRSAASAPVAVRDAAGEIIKPDPAGGRAGAEQIAGRINGGQMVVGERKAFNLPPGIVHRNGNVIAVDCRVFLKRKVGSSQSHVTRIPELLLLATRFLLSFPHQLPRLLDCKIPFCADAVIFLRLHPTPVKLRLIPDFNLARPTYSSSPILLPVLREFRGPAWTAREVVPHSSIEVVTLAWNESFPEMYHIVLNGFSGMQEPLRVMNNLVFAWDPVFLLAIAKHLPRLAVCNIWKMIPLRVRFGASLSPRRRAGDSRREACDKLPKKGDVFNYNFLCDFSADELVGAFLAL